MKIITAGNKYLDIDAYASCIAYAHLLNVCGEEAEFVSTAETNASVCSLVKDLNFKYKTNYEPQDLDEFILLDLSNPEFFDSIVNKNKIIEVVDHHTGYEKYWQEKLESRSQIEFIGSVATIIFERFEKANCIEHLSQNLCKLLICAILDNTLNLKASVTTKRDRIAYKKLHKIGKVPKSFDAEYFASCEQNIKQNLQRAIDSDIKIEKVSMLLPETFAQLAVYDKEPIITKISDIRVAMDKNYSKGWILNLICLKNGKSYIFCSKNYYSKITKIIGNKPKHDVFILKHYLLRKEIMKIARQKDNK